MTIIKYSFVIFVVIFAFLIPRVYRYIIIQGYAKSDRDNEYEGFCANVPGIEEGSEDMELLPDGRVIMSSGLKWPPGRPDKHSVRGRMLILDPEGEELPQPMEVPISGHLNLDTFNPLGISKWVNEDSGDIIIFVVNVLVESTRVERFRLEQDTLTHLETIGADNPKFQMVNDLVAVGERTFYYTNLMTGQYGEWETRLLLAWGSIGYWSAGWTELVVTDLLTPNGIAISPDKRYVYVSLCYDGIVQTYKRSGEHLDWVQDTTLTHMADNIFVSAEHGQLWVTGPTILWKAMEYMHDQESNRCPTIVTSLTIDDGLVTQGSEIFRDDGELHSLGSVAIYSDVGDWYLIGSVVNKATLCRMLPYKQN